MVAIYDKLRPKSLSEFVGFSKQIQQIESLREAVGLGGQCIWITGASGWGKTTLARIIAAEVADYFQTEEIDAQDLSLEVLREWERRCAYYPMKEAYAFIVNEAHTLNTKTVSRLQTFLEADHVQRNATVIFTTTDRGQDRLFDTRFDAFPFLSRCVMVELELDADTVGDMKQYLHDQADRLGLNGKPVEAYAQLLTECQGNIRMALQAIASGKMKA